MKTSRPRLTLTTFAREFSIAPGPKFNGWIVGPAHPPCVCIKPSDIPIHEKLFDDLREEEKHYAQSGSTLWFVIYRHEPELRYGFLLSPSVHTQPTTLELSRHFNWLACMDLIARETAAGRLGEMGLDAAPHTTSGSKEHAPAQT